MVVVVVVDAVGVVAAVVEVRVAAGEGGGGVRAGQVGAGLGEAVLGLEVRRVGGQLVARGGDGGQAGEGCLAELKGGISLRL